MILRHPVLEVGKMAEAGIVVRSALEAAASAAVPGTRTSQLDEVVEDVIRTSGCRPAFKGYRGFPASSCISVNDEVIHGIPGPRRLDRGDVVKIDVGAISKGYHADSAITLRVGGVHGDVVDDLIRTATEALWAGIDRARAGSRIGDIGAAVQRTAEARGFSVVRGYTGHGIGRSLHQHPRVPNVGDPGRGGRLEPGMALAIEPMLNLGDADTRVHDDGWTVSTADGSISAHAEHTVVISDSEPLVLTAPEGRRDAQQAVDYSIAVPYPRSTFEPSEARRRRVRSAVCRSST